MSRLASAVLLLFFAAFISAPAIAWAWGVKGEGTALQNRNLAKRPQLTVAKVWDASFGKELSDWVWDTIPLRADALKMDHRIDFYVFRDSPSREAFLGKDGFSWRRERVLGGIRAGATPPKEIHKALDRIEAAFADAGVPLHIVISPTKTSIYPEYLPDAYRAAYEELARPTERALRERAKRDPAIVDLWSPIHAEKQRLASANFARPDLALLWRRNDDHWNLEGGRIQAKEIVRHVDPGLWQEEKAPVLSGKFEMIESEISRLYFKLDIREPYQGMKQSPLVNVEMRHTNVTGSNNVIVISESAVTPTHSPKKETVLVVRDSFLSDYNGRPSAGRNGGMEALAPFFEKVVFLHWDTISHGKKALPPRIRGIDRVVIQVTQGSNYYLTRRTRDLEDLARMVKKGQGQVDDDKNRPRKKPDRHGADVRER